MDVSAPIPLRPVRGASSEAAPSDRAPLGPVELEAPDLERLDLEAFGRDLDEARGALGELGPADERHLRRIAGAGRLCTAVGLATAWMPLNPLAPVALALGRSARWAMIGHHVCHGGYDRRGDGSEGSDGAEDAPRRSRVFARGRRRLTDWFDWLVPEGWAVEHNLLHHYRLGEEHDPDQVQLNVEWLRRAAVPVWVKTLVVAVLASVWKWTYYAPNLMRALEQRRSRERATQAGAGRRGEVIPLRDTPLPWNPWTEVGRAFYLRALLPYAGVQFVLLPGLVALVSPAAGAMVLAHSLLAEVLTNLHTFLIIVTNHAGDDLYRFEGSPRTRDEYYLRQVLGSTNYRTGGDLNDFLHGWLNYQIEHHLWPDLSMLQYRAVQPRVKEICAAHGVPYVQESVWRRLRKTVDVMVGRASMPVLSAPPRSAAPAPGDRAPGPGGLALVAPAA